MYEYKVPLQDVPRGVAQERIEKHTAYDWYHTHMTSYYDVMKYLGCSTCGSMHHTAAQTRRPTDRRVRQQKQPGNHSNTARTNYRTRVVLLPALLQAEACVAL